MAQRRSNVGDITPVLSQLVAMPSGSNRLCRPTAVSICTDGGSDINAASNFVENHSHLLTTGQSQTQKKDVIQIFIEKCSPPLQNYEGRKSCKTESRWSQVVYNIKLIRTKNKSRW